MLRLATRILVEHGSGGELAHDAERDRRARLLVALHVDRLLCPRCAKARAEHTRDVRVHNARRGWRLARQGGRERAIH